MFLCIVGRSSSFRSYRFFFLFIWVYVSVRENISEQSVNNSRNNNAIVVVDDDDDIYTHAYISFTLRIHTSHKNAYTMAQYTPSIALMRFILIIFVRRIDHRYCHAIEINNQHPNIFMNNTHTHTNTHRDEKHIIERARAHFYICDILSQWMAQRWITYNVVCWWMNDAKDTINIVAADCKQ